MSLPSDFLAKSLWATTFYSRIWADHVAESPAIIEHLYRLRDAEKNRIASGIAPGAKSSYGIFESNFDLFTDPHPGLQRLKRFIRETVQHAVVHVNGSNMDPRKLNVSVVDSWFHITNDGGFHDAHFHGGCSWCGIYYLQIGDSGPRAEGSAPNGGNRFYSPHRSGGVIKDFGNQYLDFNYIDPPLRDGMLLLFPSYLMHSGLAYQGTKDRIIISFNSWTAMTSQERI